MKGIHEQLGGKKHREQYGKVIIQLVEELR